MRPWCRIRSDPETDEAIGQWTRSDTETDEAVGQWTRSDTETDEAVGQWTRSDTETDEAVGQWTRSDTETDEATGQWTRSDTETDEAVGQWTRSDTETDEAVGQWTRSDTETDEAVGQWTRSDTETDEAVGQWTRSDTETDEATGQWTRSDTETDEATGQWTRSDTETDEAVGWPRLLWFVTDGKHVGKPPKDWSPPLRDARSDPAYIEYKTSKEGSTMGITVTHAAMLAHCHALTQACGYVEGSISSCDAFLNVFQARGLRPEVICPCASSAEAMTVALRRPPEMGVPPPGKAVLSMSRLSYGVIRVDTEEKLSVLTLQDVGQAMPGALVCVVRPEGTPCLCRTDEVGEICVSSSSSGSSYFGLPGMTKNVFEMVPVTASGSPASDRLFTRTSLLGFVGPNFRELRAVKSQDNWSVRQAERLVTDVWSCCCQDNLLFVVGKMDGLMMVSGRRHNADDVVATALAVEPMKFVYRGRIAVFSVYVLHDERIVVVAEQRPDASEEDSFQWMSRVLQLSVAHSPVCSAHSPLLCPAHMPPPEVGPASMIVGNLVAGKRIAQACGRDLAQLEDNDQARKFLYMQDVLQWRAQATPEHSLFLLLNAKGTVASTASCLQLHKRAERVSVALMEKGRLNPGDHVALVYPPGTGAAHSEQEPPSVLTRYQNFKDFCCIDLIATFYGCLYAGCVPVTVRPPHPQNLATTLPTVKMIVEVSKSVCILTTQAIMKLLKSKEATAAVDVKTWPMVLDTGLVNCSNDESLIVSVADDLPRKKTPQMYKPPTPETLAYLDFSVSTTGILAGVKVACPPAWFTMSHAATTALCRSVKLQCELYPSRQIAICLDPYCGLGFALWCLCSVYSGHQSILVPPLELESNVSLWLSAVSQFKVRVTFCSYSVMEMCTKGLGSQAEALRLRNVNLSCVRTCMVVAEERPRINLTQSFSKIFKDLGLSPRAVSTTFGCRVNVAICLQPNRLGNVAEKGTAGPDPTTVYVDMRALRHDRKFIEYLNLASGIIPVLYDDSLPVPKPPAVCTLEDEDEDEDDCKLMQMEAAADPDYVPSTSSNPHVLSQIWVSAPHNGAGYYTVYGEEALHADHFCTRLSFGDTQTVWARTGYLGFLRRTELTDASGERHDALYVVGALDETLELRGMRYHPIDIETSVIRSHKSIAECAVFTWTNLLVVVVELEGSEQEALDLVALVTNVVLEEHYLIVGVVVVVDPGVIPINSRGEKQRMHLRDGFLGDQLDPIYVAYNM
ncbi:hypothetical protein P4O66_002490 [Electrophorus voltai]|uniref:DMAP1-binding domain-containing protein n=1 Tax=Electrophorus voltai TaxID=2609070 RepID=A0AAD9DNX6_9TELE|nr:hypothetical protein P4O66_002490 [Electrophorus voltai]